MLGRTAVLLHFNVERAGGLSSSVRPQGRGGEGGDAARAHLVPRASHSTCSPRPRAASAPRSSACASTERQTPLSLTKRMRAAVRPLSLSRASCAQGVERKAVSTNRLLTRSSESGLAWPRQARWLLTLRGSFRQHCAYACYFCGSGLQTGLWLALGAGRALTVPDVDAPSPLLALHARRAGAQCGCWELEASWACWQGARRRALSGVLGAQLCSAVATCIMMHSCSRNCSFVQRTVPAKASCLQELHTLDKTPTDYLVTRGRCFSTQPEDQHS